MFNTKQQSPTQQLSPTQPKPSASHALKGKAPKLSSALIGFGLSIATTLGTTLGLASMASAVTLSDLFLPPSPGYRNARGELNVVPMNVDGNRVEVFYLDIAEGTTEFCLQLDNDVSWWKGIKVFGRSNALNGFIARTGEARTRQCDSFETSALNSGDGTARVEIWKAKAFGVHTHVDTLNLDPEIVDGKRVIFVWGNE